MTLDEFRELTKDLPGELQLLVYDSDIRDDLLDSGEIGTYILESVQETMYVQTEGLVSALILGG